MAVSIKDHVAIVTGAGSGIGRAICQRLSQDGCHIFAVGRTQKNLEETKALVESNGVKCVIHPADVAVADACVSIVSTCIQSFGKLNILVNNAGQAVTFSHPVELWDEAIDVNLKAAMRLSKLSHPHLKTEAEKKNRCAIINIGSLSGVQAFGDLTPYCATKFGLNGFSNALFDKIRNEGIKVSVINPGWVETPMLDGYGIRDPKMTPDQVAHTVHFVVTFPGAQCSPSARLIALEAHLSLAESDRR